MSEPCQICGPHENSLKPEYEDLITCTMVVCGAPIFSYAACAPNLQYGGFCPVNNGIPCNQRYPTAAILASVIGSAPPPLSVPPPLPPSPTMVLLDGSTSSTSTTPNSSPPPQGIPVSPIHNSPVFTYDSPPPPLGNIPVSPINNSPVFTYSSPPPSQGSIPVSPINNSPVFTYNSPPPPQGNIAVSPINNSTVFTYNPITRNYQIVPPPQGTISVSSNALLNSNTTFNYKPVPTSYQIVQLSQINQPIPCKAPSNQTNTTVSNVVPCNQAVVSCNPILQTSTLVPCQQRVVNGTSVVQCTPGMCPTAVYTNGNLEMCPLASSTVAYGAPKMSIAQSIYTTTGESWKQSYGMEQVWQFHFQRLFQHYYPDTWALLPVSKKPIGAQFYENVDSAKVRFCCTKCLHGWTSMKGRVAFWFYQSSDRTEGVVCLKLYGQQCQRCKLKDVFEPAMWYPEEVIKVLVNIYNRVGQVYYGFLQAPYHKTRRAGKPRTPHNSELCQACEDGVCAERR